MTNSKTEFERASQDAPKSFLAEFLEFLSYNKKWWLLPILLVMFLLVAVIWLGASSFAPFIYPLF